MILTLTHTLTNSANDNKANKHNFCDVKNKVWTYFFNSGMKYDDQKLVSQVSYTYSLQLLSVF